MHHFDTPSFCVYRVHGFYVFSIGFFISYLRQDKKVDNVKLNSTYLHSPIFRYRK